MREWLAPRPRGHTKAARPALLQPPTTCVPSCAGVCEQWQGEEQSRSEARSLGL